MTDRCPCRCHDAATEDGVDLRDPIEAALACAGCCDDHRQQWVDEPPSRPVIRGDTSTSWDGTDPRNPEGAE